MPGAHRVARPAEPTGLPADEHAARTCARSAPKIMRDELGAPGADEAGDPENVAGAEREARVLDDARPA